MQLNSAIHNWYVLSRNICSIFHNLIICRKQDEKQSKLRNYKAWLNLQALILIRDEVNWLKPVYRGACSPRGSGGLYGRSLREKSIQECPLQSTCLVSGWIELNQLMLFWLYYWGSTASFWGSFFTLYNMYSNKIISLIFMYNPDFAETSFCWPTFQPQRTGDVP